MDEPRILKFPTIARRPAASPAIAPARIADDEPQPELAAILHAWNEATDRLQRTHESLRAEVRRLTNELEAKNRELARQNRLADLGQMASHVAHEVRNSLVPMKLYLSLLRRRISGDAGSTDVLDKVTAGFSALEATVSDLLHFSSDREPQWLTFSVRGLLSEICESLAPQLAAQGIRHEIDCPNELSVRADRDMLRRALLNLVLNAVDAMPGGGLLTITVCPSAAGLEIEVGDSGPGIAADLIDRLFEPFVTTKSHGTGLGLAIVERIAKAHGGHVVAMNGAEGGAAFTLTIPHHARAAEKAA
ncbi:MAG: ATP-binding protein [Planctomycetaceae bacterium]|nr:ATP-binding protein [Planctomycetaceae bacterium]